MIQFLFVDPWPWWLGGFGDRFFCSPLLYYFLNTPLGVSTGFGNLARGALRQ
jgi:hypothetical protein